MTPEQELEFEQVCRHKTEEDAWWSLFRLLIPDMHSRDIASLATEYSPCEYTYISNHLDRTYKVTIDYIHYHTSLMVPAMSFPALSYQPVPAPHPPEGPLVPEK